ncbi:MAG TPA: hypothetical protein VJS45_19250 [Acidimicrobiia bacterium]|nr:hypothetical protein [Acidimicrobiia bacterium]
MRRLGLAVPVASAAATAVYTIVYLYRWEWHRALVAAVFLVVAEVALATVAILRRLSALDHRLDTLSAAPPPPDTVDVLSRVRESAPPPRPVFAWLTPQGTNVFLPILLGAGVLASAAAWVVETLARATARPVLERRLATRLGALALPGGGLLQPAPAMVTTPSRRAPRVLRRAGLTVVVVCGFAVGIAELADATQSRPHRARTGVRTVVELELHGQLAAAIPERVVTSLWESCAGTLRRNLPDPVVTGVDGSRFRLEILADLGVSTTRRIHGCLEDAALDQVQAGVVMLTSPAS